MIKVIEIEGYKYHNANTAKSKLKGNTVRYSYVKSNNLLVDETIENSNLAIIQTKTSLVKRAKTLERSEATVLPHNKGKIEHQISKTIPINIQNQRQFACLSPRPSTPIMARQYTKALTESGSKLKQKSSTLITKQMPRYLQLQEKAVKLSLSHFQERMKSISQERKGEKIQQKAITFKLEGINCKIDSKNSKVKHKKQNLDLSIFTQKRSAIYLTQHPASNQPQKTVSKVETQIYKPLSQFNSQSRQALLASRRYHNNSTVSRKSIGSRKIESAKPRPKINIINMVDGAPFQKKRNSNQIFAKFNKADDDVNQTENKKKQSLKIKMDLYEQLNQIRRQINNRKEINTQHVLPRQKNIKYTTNFIEERLSRRKSLIKDYTFKRTTPKVKAKCIVLDDFHVQGWNNHQLQHKEGIAA